MTHRSPTARDPLVTKNFSLLVVAHFLQALGYSSMLLLPLYLEHLRASRSEIGAVMATAAVTEVAIRPWVAWSLDRWGRKPTLIIGTLFLSSGMLMILGVHEIGALIYIARALVGLGIGALFSAYFTYAADLIPISRRTEGLALFGISGLLPLMINPFADRLSVAATDLRWFLPIVGLLILLSLVPLSLLPESRRREEAATERPMREAIGELVKPELWAPWLATVVFAGLVAVFMTFATVVAAARGVENAPVLWLTYALGAVMVRAFGARLPDRVGPANILAPALGLYIGAMLLAAHAGSLSDFLVAALLAGIGHGYCFPVLTSQVVSRSPDTFRGTALTLFTTLWALSELIITPALGAVADRFGDATMFHGAAIAGISSLAFWAVLEHRFGPLAHRPRVDV
jgi:MFS family permease